LRKTVFGIMLILLLIGMLIFTFNINADAEIHVSTLSVACIYSTDLGSAQEYTSLLTANGITVDLINCSSAERYNYTAYSVVIIGGDTGSWQTYNPAKRTLEPNAAVSMINRTGKPILALGEGGYDFFGGLGLYIGAPHGMHNPAQQQSIYVLNITHPIVNYALNVSIPPDRVIQLYTSSADVSIYYPSPIAGVIPLGRRVDKWIDHYPLMQEGTRYVLWGFTSSPANMTQSGKDIFINLVLWLSTCAEPAAPSPADPEIIQMVEAVSTETEMNDLEKGEVIDFLNEAPPDIKKEFTKQQICRQYALSAVSYMRNKPVEHWTSNVSKELLYDYIVPLFTQYGDYYGLSYAELNFRPVFQSLVRNVTKDMNATDPYLIARTLCSWVFHNIKYGLYSSGPYTPLRTFEFKKGKCMQKAELFIALCKSIGLPARLIYIQSCTHLAAQVYISNKGWIPADPTIESHLFDVHEGYTFWYSHFWHADAVYPLNGAVDVTYHYSLDGLYALMNLTERYVDDERTLNPLRALLSETEDAFKNQRYDEAQAKGSTLKTQIKEALPLFTLRTVFVNEENNETLPYAKFFFLNPLIWFRSSAIWGVTDENGGATITFRPGYYDIRIWNEKFSGEIYELQIVPNATTHLVINVSMGQYCLDSKAGLGVTVVDDDTGEKVSANVTFVDADTGEEVGEQWGPDWYMVLCFREPYVQRRVYILAHAPGYVTAKSTVFTMHFGWDGKLPTIKISKTREITNDVGEPFKPPEPYVLYNREFYDYMLAHCDLNGDEVINIIDIATVDKAFGTKPGDKNWNPKADLNNDGIINIIDIAMVAKEFGKKV
jgi:hypothetical protein